MGLTDFKAKARRKDKLAVRLLPISPKLARLLDCLERRPHDPKGYVFLNERGKPWTTAALCQAFRTAARRAGLNELGKEAAVAYTLRHTAATAAIINGVQLPVLAAILDHTSTTTTERYVHVQKRHVLDAIKVATAHPKRHPKAAAKPKPAPPEPLWDQLKDAQ